MTYFNDEPSSFKDVFKQMMHSYNLNKSFEERKIIRAYPTIVGDQIAAETTQIYIKDDKLFLQFDQAIIRHEVFLLRDQILHTFRSLDFAKDLKEIVVL